MHNNKLAKTTLVVTIILLLSKLSGFLRDVALAYAYGTTLESDAFVLSQSVISIFSYLLFVAVGIAFIPIYTQLKIDGKPEELNAFVDSTYSVAGTIILAVSLLGILGADLVVSLLAPGFSPEAHTLGVKLTRIVLPSVFLIFLTTIQGQQLRGENRFLPSSFLAFPLNFILIAAFVFLTPYVGIEGAGAAYLVGTVLQVGMLSPFVKQLGYRFRYRFDLKNPGLRKMLLLTLPILLGNTIQTIDHLVNRILASGLAEGSMSALNYSNKLSIFIVGVVSLGAGTVCYTKMSELGAKKEVEELKGFLRTIINLLNLIIVPASIGMMALHVPLIRLVFEYGAFNAASSEITSVTLWYYSIGLVGFVLRDIITKAFYALNDSKTPMINGGIAVAIGIVANLILVQFMGIGGLALATSVSGILGTVLLLASLRRKLGRIGLWEMSLTFGKAVLAAVVMGFAVHRAYLALFEATGSLLLSVLLSILCGVLVYGVTILLLRVKEVALITDFLKGKQGKR